MANVKNSLSLLKLCLENHVGEFCICAGARNAPLVVASEFIQTFYSQNNSFENSFKLYSFFEERSAGFFALGRSQNQKKPVALITTSGTAVAELLPAAIEAHYTNTPLVLITADRPRSYRQSGAPQTIEQIGIFSHYVEKFVDLDEKEFVSQINFIFQNWSGTKPLHINVCFDEPLLESQSSFEDFKNYFTENFKNICLNPRINNFKPKQNADVDLSPSIFEKLNQPVVILSTLSQDEAEFILPILESWGAPIYAEGISNLRGHPRLKHLELKSGEKILSEGFAKGLFDGVIRFGGIPTVRLWRDLEDKLSHIPVVSWSSLEFSGLSRASEHSQDWQILKYNKYQKSFKASEIFKRDQQMFKALEELMFEFPHSEFALIQQLSQKIYQDRLYLGNSLPIREWDLAASFNHRSEPIFANRGANGIDGQVSSFLGVANSQTTWALMGDLTAMYDLSALWITPQLNCGNLRLIIMNNFGGRIFKNIFKKDIFMNPHQVQFKHWAKMWSWDYVQWEEIPTNFSELPKQVVIELLPNAEHTAFFNEKWEALWKNI